MTNQTLAILCVGASLVVAGLALHYVIRARRRIDMLCFLGMVVAQMGLLQSGRAAEGASNLFFVASPSFALFAFALGIWRIGLQRLRSSL